MIKITLTSCLLYLCIYLFIKQILSPHCVPGIVSYSWNMLVNQRENKSLCRGTQIIEFFRPQILRHSCVMSSFIVIGLLLLELSEQSCFSTTKTLLVLHVNYLSSCRHISQLKIHLLIICVFSSCLVFVGITGKNICTQ